MSERFIIEISSEKARMLRRIAEITGQSVESLISRGLVPMPPDDSLDEQIKKITTYSDEQLWAIVETPVLSEEEEAAWNLIVDRMKQGEASEKDRVESKKFSELYNKRGLLRAKALAELLARSYDVHTYLEKNAPK